jgi:hypothetical protein
MAAGTMHAYAAAKTSPSAENFSVGGGGELMHVSVAPTITDPTASHWYKRNPKRIGV